MNKKIVFTVTVLVLLALFINLKISDEQVLEPIESSEGAITIHNESESYEGLNFFNKRSVADVTLMDNEGYIRHQWGPWNISRRYNNPLMLEGGDFVRIYVGNNITRYGYDSEIVWNNDLEEMGPHHDADMFGDKIVTYAWDAMELEYLNDSIVFDEQITSISKDSGEKESSFSLYSILEDYPEIDMEEEIEGLLEKDLPQFFAEDILRPFHANGIYFIDQDFNENFREGTFLATLRNINTVALIDYEEQEVLWDWGQDVLDYPHDARMTDNGTMMVFDNGMDERNYSRVLEVDVETEEIVWSYNKEGDKDFHTRFMGGAQPLPNGNVLITESMGGRAFEVNREGEKVWEFQKEGEYGEDHQGIFKMVRYSEECVEKVFRGEKTSSADCR